MNNIKNNWIGTVERLMQSFANRYSYVYSRRKRELSASFEIGCFLAIVNFYENQQCTVSLKNLWENNQFRYLTTPNGNPINFSFVCLSFHDYEFEIRQQVRIKSHLDSDIAFTPDIVILKQNTDIRGVKEQDYASGKRRFFFVDSDRVIAAHECKSLIPFPELLISFLGMLAAGHAWLRDLTDRSMIDEKGIHLAPTLFVGGTARGIHIRMVQAMRRTFPINIILGMHSGTWDLFGENAEVIRLRNL